MHVRGWKNANLYILCNQIDHNSFIFHQFGHIIQENGLENHKLHDSSNHLIEFETFLFNGHSSG